MRYANAQDHLAECAAEKKIFEEKKIKEEKSCYCGAVSYGVMLKLCVKKRRCRVLNRLHERFEEKAESNCQESGEADHEKYGIEQGR